MDDKDVQSMIDTISSQTDSLLYESSQVYLTAGQWKSVISHYESLLIKQSEFNDRVNGQLIQDRCDERSRVIAEVREIIDDNKTEIMDAGHCILEVVETCDLLDMLDSMEPDNVTFLGIKPTAKEPPIKKHRRSENEGPTCSTCEEWKPTHSYFGDCPVLKEVTEGDESCGDFRDMEPDKGGDRG